MIARLQRALVLTLLAGCSTGGGETGNPVAGTPVAISVRSSEPEVISLDPNEGGALLEEAWFAFGDVAFLDGDACANFGEIDVIGAARVITDLTRDNPGLMLDAARGSYCGLVVPLTAANTELPADAPEELATSSIVLRGRRADGVPFVLTYPEQDELELAAEEGDIELGDVAFVLSFDIAALMRDVDLDAATERDGVIRIDGVENVALLERFEVSLECSVQLYEDGDNDGVLDAGEAQRARCYEEEDEGDAEGESDAERE